MISLNTVYNQVKAYAEEHGLGTIRVDKNLLHATRNMNDQPLVSEMLYEPMPADPETFIASVEKEFESDFFLALRRMIKAQGTGPGYIQSILDVPLLDAKALHRELSH